MGYFRQIYMLLLRHMLYRYDPNFNLSLWIKMLGVIEVNIILCIYFNSLLYVKK